MKNFSIVAVFLTVFISCDDDKVISSYVDPRYAQMSDVRNITSTSATFELKIKHPVVKVSDGYKVDDKYFERYQFFYTTDPDQHLRLWQRIEGSPEDDSGVYSLDVSDLSPNTTYYVRTGVFIAPRNVQQFNMSISGSIMEFATNK
jgi:hypothetical protein